jgi:hypothetical protein
MQTKTNSPSTNSFASNNKLNTRACRPISHSSLGFAPSLAMRIEN